MQCLTAAIHAENLAATVSSCCDCKLTATTMVPAAASGVPAAIREQMYEARLKGKHVLLQVRRGGRGARERQSRQPAAHLPPFNSFNRTWGRASEVNNNAVAVLCACPVV